MSGIWHVELFGGLRIVQPDRAITRFRTQKTAALLAFLALHRDRAHPRETLIALLWPDEPIDAGRNGLRVALNSLRKQLEPLGNPYGSVLFADRNQVQLSAAACSTDVGRFTELLRQADRETDDSTRAIAALVEATAIYRGELLPAFYDEWILLERDRLAQMHVNSLVTLSKQLVDAEEYDQAMDYANRAIQAAPYSEEAYRILMTAQARKGNLAAVRQWFDRLAEVLETEFGSQPALETIALLERYQLEGRVDTSLRKTSAKPRLVATPPPAVPRSKVEVIQLPNAAPESPQDSLPYSFTRFFGREAEMALLAQLLSIRTEDAGTRSLTLTGSGGTGKTRLAVEAARLLAPAYDGEVIFVSLSDEHDASRIVEAIVRSAGLPRSVTADYWDVVTDRLNRAPVLLILDGFEHLAADGGGIVLALRKSAPGVRVLVTSRRRLEIPGEREIPVAPLPVPEKQDTAVSVPVSPSVLLFLDRAQAVTPDFAVTPRNSDDLAAVCRALEGIPLAIELAAARTRSIGLHEMREQLTEPTAAANRFHLLTSRRADKPDRQRSLWAAIAWSVELLPPSLRLFFAHLSVFRGGFTLGAAATVCGEPYAREYLTQLRAHSLVQHDQETFPEQRFRLLDSLREFATELLPNAESEAIALRHIDFFVGLADESRQRLRGSDQTTWLKKLDAENENIRAALRWCLSHPGRASEAGLRFAGSLAHYWQLHGPLRESAELVAKLLNQTEVLGVTPDRAAAFSTAAGLCLRLGDHDGARRYLANGLEAYRGIQDQAGIGRMIMNRGYLHWAEGNLQASYEDRRESLGIFLRVGDRWQAAAAYLNLGSVERDLGDQDAAADSFERSLAISREIGDLRGAGSAILNLANIAYGAGDLHKARIWYEESLAIAREQENPLGTALALSNLGAVLLGSGDLDAAEVYFDEALALGRQMGDNAMSGSFLIELGRIAMARGDLAQAHDTLAESLTHDLSHVKQCVVLETFARLCALRNEPERAAFFLGSADRLRRTGGSPIQPHEQAAQEEQKNQIRARLGAEKFEANWRLGQSADRTDAILAARNVSRVKSPK